MIYIDDIQVPITMFPDNTSQVWKLPPLPLKAVHTVRWEFTHEGEFMQLAQLKTLLDACGLEAKLRVDYLPYARQDKDVANDATFALHAFAHLLNSLKFRGVQTMDVHSSRAEIIHGLNDWAPFSDIQKLARDLLCYPDIGARGRYWHGLSTFDSVYADKTRDPGTGQIKLELVDSAVRIKGRHVLIIDDICDGGMTFILAAKELLKRKPKSIELYVTHGIFSKGTRCLFDAGISRIYTHKGEVTRRYGADNV